MVNIKKRVFRMLLSLAMLICMMPTVYAESTDETGQIYEKVRLELPGNSSRIYQTGRVADAIFAAGEDDYGNLLFYQINAADIATRILPLPHTEPVYIVGSSMEELYPVIFVDEAGQNVLCIYSETVQKEQIMLELPEQYKTNILTALLLLPEHIIVTLGDEILALSRKGEFEVSLGKFQKTSCCIVLSDGRLLVAREVAKDSVSSMRNTAVNIYDSSLKLQQSFQSDRQYDALCPGDEEETLIAFRGSIVYAFQYAENIETPQIDTNSSGMNARELFCLTNSQFLSIERGIPFLWKIREDGPEIELVLAAYGISNTVKQIVAAYNEYSADCKIKVIDYADFEYVEGDGSGLTRLRTEVTAGFTPDLYEMSGLNSQDLVEHGLLEDLEPWLTNTLPSLLPNAVEALRTDGKLYEIMPSYTLMTVLGSEELLNGTDVFTSEDFFQMAKGKAAVDIIGPEISKEEFLQTLLIYRESDYLDRKTGKCDFINSDFESWLNFAAGLPEEVDYSQIGSQDISRVMAGDQQLVIYNTAGNQVALFSCYNTAFDGNAAYIGFPCNGISKSAFIPSALIGISSASQHKADASSFLEFMLGDYCQTGSLVPGLPILQSAAEARLEYWISDYKQFPRGLITYYDDVTYRIEGSTPAEAAGERVKELMASADVLAQYDSTLYSLILAECQPFFQGAIPSSQAVSRIQSKVSLYLAEQYG